MDVGVLMFGDSGYHLNWPDEEDYVDRFTLEQYQQKEHEDWLEDKRPPDLFEVSPGAVSPATGGYVAASGMNAVSLAMREYCATRARCDFGVMLGDNIYPDGFTLGEDGRDDDERFRDTIGDPFGNIVTDPDHYLTYVTLGNHDWKTSRSAGFMQIEYLQNAPSFYMPAPFYSVQPEAGRGQVELFIVDTSMMLANVAVLEDELNDDGSEVYTGELATPSYYVQPLTEAEKNQAQWLENALRTSTARWKFVIAHHPIWSSSGSKFEQARSLRALILPAMCRYADAYIVGHEHTLEIHEDDCSAALGQATDLPLVHMVSGAASKQRPLNQNFMRQQQEKYPELETIWAGGLLWGFAHMQVMGDTATVELLTVPDDGSADITVAHRYQFKRRSQLATQAR